MHAATGKRTSNPRPLGAAVTALLTALVLAGCGEAADESTPVPSMESHPMVLSVVYERGDDVMIRRRGGAAARLLAGARYPRFSADGTQVAAVRGSSVVVVSAEGGEDRVVARGDAPQAVAWDAAGKRVYFSDGKRIQVVDADGGQVTTVRDGYRVLELDAGPDGALVGTVKGLGYAIYRFPPDGEPEKLAAGCSASFSPDGALVSNLLDGHRGMSLMSVRNGVPSRSITAPGEIRYDNHVWTNHPDWIAGETEGERHDIVLIHAVDGRVLRVTDDGDAHRGDVFIH